MITRHPLRAAGPRALSLLLSLSACGAPPEVPLPTSCATNADCSGAGLFCDQVGDQGECRSCQDQGCGEACQPGPGRCLDPLRLRYCYQGQIRVVNCALTGKTCGARTTPVPSCEAQAAACRLSQCTATGFSYSCATSSRTTTFSYGGPGPNGLSSYTVKFTNGHSVSCRFSSSTHGRCADDAAASCTF